MSNFCFHLCQLFLSRKPLGFTIENERHLTYPLGSQIVPEFCQSWDEFRVRSAISLDVHVIGHSLVWCIFCQQVNFSVKPEEAVYLTGRWKQAFLQLQMNNCRYKMIKKFKVDSYSSQIRKNARKNQKGHLHEVEYFEAFSESKVFCAKRWSSFCSRLAVSSHLLLAWDFLLASGCTMSLCWVLQCSFQLYQSIEAGTHNRKEQTVSTLTLSYTWCWAACTLAALRSCPVCTIPSAV